MADYILGIDQSTQGTKALLFDEKGEIVCRTAIPHRQIINNLGWIEHDPEEIYRNAVEAVRCVIGKSGIDRSEIKSVGISNQRETAMIWNRYTGTAVYNAVVWQCARGAAICERLSGHADEIRAKTGLPLSPYFSAAKLAWIIQNVPGVKEGLESGRLVCGTIDSWLVYNLTYGKEHKTDFSNASRTQLFNLNTLKWDNEICDLFGVPIKSLPKITCSDGFYGKTDFDGYLLRSVPIHAVMGDSHSALFGQGCHAPGMIKATYGTGSSIMMNIGEQPVFSDKIVTSVAFAENGSVSYAVEGNINYAGAVITWLKDDLKLIESSSEAEALTARANKNDTAYLVPAFSGLGAPYWDNSAKAAIIGMSRTTGKAEIVKAAVESIAYQVCDVIRAMKSTASLPIGEIRADGGPAKNDYLMQFQSDLLNIPVTIPRNEELSAIGAAYMAGIAIGLYRKETLFEKAASKRYLPNMSESERNARYNGWQNSIQKVLGG